MGKRVLVVQPTALMMMMIKDVLKKNGYEVAGEAGGGKECVERYRELRPDLVILDTRMKDGMTYREVLPMLQQEDPPARVLMCSELQQQAVIDDMLSHGAAGFVPKPLKPEALLAKLRELCP